MTTWDPANKDASIALSSGNLTATSSLAAAWKSVISNGSGKSAGRCYYRLKMNLNGSDTAGAAFCLNTEPTSNLLGNDPNGWLGYINVGATGGIWHNGGLVAGFPVLGASGDYIVAAYDATHGALYFTTMTAAGAINTNWNGANANPSTNTGGLAATPGMPLQPGASFNTAGDSVILDTISTISDSTLSGFQPYDSSIVLPSTVGEARWNHAANVMPLDAASLPAGSDFISFNNSGSQTIQVTMLGGETLILTGLASGVLHPIRATKVWASGTTVTNIVAYWR